MTVYLVGAGPGDPGLLTVKGADLLRRAEVVVHDRLVSAEVLALAGPGALRIDVGKRHGTGTAQADRRQREIIRLLVEHGRRAAVVVRLKGGDPFVFGRGGEEAAALEAAGVPWEVVPGVSSVIGVPAAAGIPLTHRGLASSFTVVTGQVSDRPSQGIRGCEPDWQSLAASGGTLVVLMGMGSLPAIAASLVGAGRPPDTPCAVISDGTTPHQRMVRTTLGRLPEVGLGPPGVIVVGPVVDAVRPTEEQAPARSPHPVGRPARAEQNPN
ncbi:MAG TPA: uroporphyrinogen-III C-methyltransferase [Acidimicrobiales bacterium]|nr:uroporphyrinogen-III C-methyltransferase [Acidimicrobiales bacterium]